MPIFTYSEYCNLVPADTVSFINRLISYLMDTEYIEYNGRGIFDENDRLFFKALKAYVDTNEINANAAQRYGYSCSYSFDYNSYSDSTKAKTFTKYYKAFTPFNHKDEYVTITPEDIIDHIFKKLLNGNRFEDSRTVECLRNGEEKFFKGLSKVSEDKKSAIVAKKGKDFNEDFSLNVINYFETAGKIFLFLRNLKNNNAIDVLSDNDKKNLALLLAIFHYNGVSINSSFNEQQAIISFLETNGVTSDQIEKQLNIFINMKALDSLDPTIVLSQYFSSVRIPSTYKRDTTVGQLFNRLINNGYDDSIIVKKILGSLNIPLANVSKVSEELRRVKDEANDTSLDDFYRNLMPNVISYIKRVVHIYTYLLSKKDKLDKSYLETNYDFRALAIFLSSFEFDNQYAKFFTEHGITLDNILELLGLPKKDEYIKEINAIESNEKLATEFGYLVTGGHNYNNSRSNVNVNAIVNNLDDKDRTKSGVVHKIYNSLTGNKLNDSYGKQMSEYFNKKEDARKHALTEELLGSLSIDVYNFLKTLSNYYTIFKGLNLDQVDREQLAIIYAASRHDPKIEKYLDSLGMERSNMSKKLNISFNYDKKTFDIDAINDAFGKYIFDRPKDQITVYSIFENAFNPALVNTIRLRKLLFEYGKEPEDFIGIEGKLQAYEKEQERKRLEQIENEMLKKCDNKARKIIEDTLLLHELISTNMDSYPLVSTTEDVQELSLLIAILLNDESYVPFFTRNGVTLDEILTKVGLDKEMLTSIRKMSVNKSLILKYDKYLNGSSINTQKLIKALFNDQVNPSKVIESITALTGNKYEYLVEEVESQKERELTPEQGIQVLTAEEVEVIPPSSLSAIADYGLSVSKHSKYINDALHQIMFADTLEHSLDEINRLLGEVSYEEELPRTHEPTFLERLFAVEEPVQTIKKYNPSKISDIETQVDIQISSLTKELQGYEYIKRYIEVYLRKLTEYLERLKQYRDSMDTSELDPELDELTKFTQSLNRSSAEKIIQDKITTFETMILLMKQELMAVHCSIINHFVTINSLQTSKMAILPLIATEMAINMGKATESESLQLTGELVDLLQNVVNKNVEATQENLNRLRLSSISEETYNALSGEVTRYISTVDRSKKLLAPAEEDKEDENKRKL